MQSIELISISTDEVIIANKEEFNDQDVQINFTRNINHIDNTPDLYLANCFAEMYLLAEKDQDAFSRSFYVKVSMQGEARCLIPEQNRNDNLLHAEIVKEIFPHLRATLASVMSVVGLSPFFLPPLTPLATSDNQ